MQGCFTKANRPEAISGRLNDVKTVLQLFATAEEMQQEDKHVDKI